MCRTASTALPHRCRRLHICTYDPQSPLHFVNSSLFLRPLIPCSFCPSLTHSYRPALQLCSLRQVTPPGLSPNVSSVQGTITASHRVGRQQTVCSADYVSPEPRHGCLYLPLIFLHKERHRGDSAHSPVTCQGEMAAELQLPTCGSPHPVPKNV